VSGHDRFSAAGVDLAIHAELPQNVSRGKAMECGEATLGPHDAGCGDRTNLGRGVRRPHDAGRGDRTVQGAETAPYRPRNLEGVIYSAHGDIQNTLSMVVKSHNTPSVQSRR